MKTVEELRKTPHLIIFHGGEYGGDGEIHFEKHSGSVIWSTGGGWDHVSFAPYIRSHTPTWEEMCRLKDMFFGEDEAVMQIHPPKSEYVNNVTNCLHLWRPRKEPLPMPPSIMVGIKRGQTRDEVQAEIKKLFEADEEE